MAILDIVMAGISKLVELVPIWMNSSAEKRAEIEARARSLVAALSADFAAADARDAAATQAAKDAIKKAVLK